VSSIARKLLLSAGALAGCGANVAHAQQDRHTPKGWSYEVDQRGRRVDRTNRVEKPDGSWREEIRQGNCVAIKERSASGEYKETRQCNPAGTPAPR
jgi:hypothetical protein